MDKRKLLKLKVPVASAGMIKAAKAENTEEYMWYGKRKYRYRIGYYLSADVEDGILKVGLFSRRRLVAGSTEPLYAVYVSRTDNEFVTYDLLDNKWRTAKVDMLYPDVRDHGWGLEQVGNWQTDSDRKLVNDYFETGINREIMAAVLDFQTQVRKYNLQKKHRSEMSQIDEVMNEVPELPKDFDSWIIKKAFIKHEYLFYKKERPYKLADCLCTHCGKWTYANEKPEHNKLTHCPVCKTRVRYKSWNRQQTLIDEIYAGILQRLNDGSGYILRSFRCKVKRRYDNGWDNYELSKYEDIRVRLDESFFEREYFEYGEWKYTGIERWCHTCNKSQWSGWYGNKTFGNAIMYTRNLKRVLKGSRIEHCDVARYMRKDMGEPISPAPLLAQINRYPMVEYLEKQGLSRLVDEIINRTASPILNIDNAKNVKEALGIDGQRINRLKKLNGGCHMLKALRREQQYAERFTDEQLNHIEDERIDINDLECDRTLMSAPRMINYLLHQVEITGQSYAMILRRYSDYLDMAEERGLDITDEIICHNNRMMEFHDKYLEEKNREEAVKRDQEVNKKFSQIKADYSSNKKHFEYATDDYVIMIPKCASEITLEGRLQHHCVGASDNYMNKMNNRQTFILFMRHKKNPELPYYTLEVKWDGTVIQSYSAYDRRPDKEIVDKFLDEWTSVVEQRMNNENEANMTGTNKSLIMAAV